MSPECASMTAIGAGSSAPALLTPGKKWSTTWSQGATSKTISRRCNTAAMWRFSRTFRSLTPCIWKATSLPLWPAAIFSIVVPSHVFGKSCVDQAADACGCAYCVGDEGGWKAETGRLLQDVARERSEQRSRWR